jgi:hypothetical protein
MAALGRHWTCDVEPCAARSGAPLNATKRKTAMPKKPSTPEQHMLHIARATSRMPDAMAAVMGGPSKAQARETVAAHDGPDLVCILNDAGNAYAVKALTRTGHDWLIESLRSNPAYRFEGTSQTPLIAQRDAYDRVLRTATAAGLIVRVE